MPTPKANDVEVNKDALNIVSIFAFDVTSLILQFSLSSLLFGELDVLGSQSWVS